MTIASNDIQALLRTYNRQLRFERMNKRSEIKRAQSIEDLVHISPEGRKKQQAIELIAIQGKELQIAEKSPNKEEE